MLILGRASDRRILLGVADGRPKRPGPYTSLRHPLTHADQQNIFNECEDSLLATPLIFDLAILAELMTRITYREAGSQADFQPLYSVLSLLSYMLKAPLVKPGEDVVNSLNRQRNGLEMFLKACLGLEGSGDLLLKSRIW